MVKFRVKACVRKTPQLRHVFVRPPIDPTVYTTVYDLTGNLHVFYLDQSVNWEVKWYRRLGPLMQWANSSLGLNFGQSGPPDPNGPKAFLAALAGKDGNIYVAFAWNLTHLFCTVRGRGTPSTWVVGPNPEFALTTEPHYQITCMSLQWDPGNVVVQSGPTSCRGYGVPAIVAGLDETFLPAVAIWWPNQDPAMRSESVAGLVEPSSVIPAHCVTDIARGIFFDRLLQPDGSPIMGLYCHISPARPSPYGSLWRVGQTTSDFLTPLNFQIPASTQDMTTTRVLFLQDRSQPTKVLAPLLLGIGTVPVLAVPNATRVIFQPNTQYQGPANPETFTVLFQGALSPVNYTPWSDMPRWIEVVVEDLTSHTFGGNDGSTWTIEGTNFRVHVFALFVNATSPDHCQLLHTWSFDATAGGGGGVLETSPGIFDIPLGDWSFPVVVTADLMNMPFSVTTFQNACTITVINKAQGLTCWNQDFSRTSGSGLWTRSELTDLDSPTLSTGAPVPAVTKVPSFYMELAAIEESTDGGLCSPVANFKARIGSDHTMHLVANGKYTELRPKGPAVQVTFNSAGLLGIEMPMAFLGSKSQALFSYPMANSISRISLDDTTKPINTYIDLLMTPPELFSTFKSLTSDTLVAMRKLAPDPGVQLGAYFDPGSTGAVATGLQNMTQAMAIPLGSSNPETTNLALDSLGTINASARLANDPVSLKPAINGSVGFKMTFSTDYYRQGSKENAVLRASCAALDQPLPDPSADGLPHAFSCNDLFQSITAEPEGYLRSIAVNCRGPNMFAAIVWSRYSGLALNDSTTSWIGTISSTHELGLLFSMVLGYAGLYDDAIVSYFDQTPMWLPVAGNATQNVMAWAATLSPLIQSAPDLLATFHSTTFPMLNDTFLKQIFGTDSAGITNVFQNSAALFSSYDADYDNNTLDLGDPTQTGLPACLLPSRTPASASWLFCQFIDISWPLATKSTLIPEWLTAEQSLGVAISANLQSFESAGVLEDLVQLWNMFTSNSVFDLVPLQTILPKTTAALANAVSASPAFRGYIESLLQILVHDNVSVLKQPASAQSPSLTPLYQLISTPTGFPAPAPTVGDILALVLAAPMKVAHDILAGPNPTDRAFFDAGLTSLIGGYYGVSDVIPSPTQGNWISPLLSVALNSVMAKQFTELVGNPPTTDPILPPYVPQCLQAGVALSAFRCLVTYTDTPPVTTSDGVQLYLSSLVSYGFLASAVFSINSRGMDLGSTLDQDRLPLAYNLWRGLAGLGNLVLLAGCMDGQETTTTTPPGRSAKPRAVLDISVDVADAGMWSGFVSAACGFLAAYSRSEALMVGWKRKRKPEKALAAHAAAGNPVSSSRGRV